MEFEEMRPCRPRSWALFMFTAYVPKVKDTPDLELVDEGDGTWMVVQYGTQKYPCPEGKVFTELAAQYKMME